MPAKENVINISLILSFNLFFLKWNLGDQHTPVTGFSDNLITLKDQKSIAWGLVAGDKAQLMKEGLNVVLFDSVQGDGTEAPE